MRSIEMRRRLPSRQRASVVLALMALVAGAGVVVLNDREPTTFPRRLSSSLSDLWPKSPPTGLTDTSPPPEAAPISDPSTPLFSDDWFDDSGYSLVRSFEGPIDDPTSLEQFRAACTDRGHRGIEILGERLAGLSPKAPDTPFHRSRLNQLIGALHMYEGEFVEASKRFEAARDADPSQPVEIRANLEAMLGIAALRRGEVENCVACCNEASCLFPLAMSAVHQQPDGSRRAMDHFRRYLATRPEDLGVRWLLNLAAMTLGEYPGGVPSEYRLPLADPTPPDAPGRFVNVASRVGLAARGENMAGGCIADDFDGDGLIDIVFSTSDPGRGSAFFRNRGDGTFEDRSEAAGLGLQGGALNVSHADFDNDGRLDLLMLRGGWESPRRISLLRNVGGAFEDVTIAAGLAWPIATKAAAWGDYDRDGLVDVFVCGEYDAARVDPRNACRLYRNRGDGTFQDVAAAAGVTNLRYAIGAAWGDYDDDGDPDLYVSNLGAANRLYRNRGDGTFQDVAPSMGLSRPAYSFACWFWDYDDDGRLDLFVCPYWGTLSDAARELMGEPTGGEKPRLYRNLGPEGFRDVTASMGLERSWLPMGCNYGDIDGDGDLDIYLGTGKPPYSCIMPNVMLRNDGDRFADVTTATGTGHLQKGHGVAFADWDRDGDLDVILEAGGATPGDRAHNVLFQNPGPAGHWLRVKLVGTRSNRAALGARVRVTLPGGVVRHRLISAGSSFGGNPLATTIGLGSADRVESVQIEWPSDGPRQVLTDPTIDREIEVVEGTPGFREVGGPPIPLPDGP